VNVARNLIKQQNDSERALRRFRPIFELNSDSALKRSRTLASKASEATNQWGRVSGENQNWMISFGPGSPVNCVSPFGTLSEHWRGRTNRDQI
jgi:hypothetical protein